MSEDKTIRDRLADDEQEFKKEYEEDKKQYYLPWVFKCPRCGRYVSTRATECPECGFTFSPLRPSPTESRRVVGILAVTMVAGGAICLSLGVAFLSKGGALPILAVILGGVWLVVAVLLGISFVSQPPEGFPVMDEQDQPGETSPGPAGDAGSEKDE